MNPLTFHNAKDFFDLTFYNGLFDSVYMPNKMGACIVESGLHDTECHVEAVDEYQCCVWYPLRSWIDECKRRQDMTDMSTLHKQNWRPDPLQAKKNLQALLIKASAEGNIEKMQEIMEQMKGLK